MLGMLSIGDVLKETSHDQEELIRQLESYLPCLPYSLRQVQTGELDSPFFWLA